MNISESTVNNTTSSEFPPSPVSHADEFASGQENRIRRNFARLTATLFSPPYLPASMVFFAVLFFASLSFFLLFEQPPEYWAVRENTYFTFPFQNLTEKIVSLLVYTALLGIVLSIFNQRFALMLWIIFGLMGTYEFDSISWCGPVTFTRLQNTQACTQIEYLTLGAVSLVWAMVLSGGTVLILRRSEDSHAPKPRSITAGLILITAWIAFTGISAARNATAEQPTWRKVETAHAPSPRKAMAMAFDTARGEAVLFGGTERWSPAGEWVGKDDTWIWNGQDWVEKHPINHPSARLDLAMAYDEKRQVVVLFGGQSQSVGLGDTWEWDGENWYDRTPAANPPARCCAELAYDPQREKVVLFSGFAPNKTPPALENVFYYDAWEWDGQNWSEIHLNVPRHASSYALIPDPYQDGMLIFDIDGLWSWKSNQMRQPPFELVPPGRYNVGLAYHPLENMLYLYGGSRYEKDFNETWRFDGSYWKRIYTVKSPPARAVQAMVYNPLSGRVLMFGGHDGKAFYNDTWELIVP